jgi:hypothetical protein
MIADGRITEISVNNALNLEANVSCFTKFSNQLPIFY